MKAMPRELLPFFWHFLRRRSGTIFLMQLLFFAWSLELALWPVIVGKVIDGLKLIESQREHLWSDLSVLIWLAIALWVGTQFAFRLGGFLWANLIPKMEAEMRMEMFDYVQGHSHKFFSDHLSGSLVHNINTMVIGFVNILELISMTFLPTLGMYLISTSLYISFSPLFGLLLVVWIIIHMAACVYMAPKCCEAAHLHGATRAGLQGTIVDSLTNYIAVKLFAHEKGEREYVGMQQKMEMKAYTKAELQSLKLCAILGVLSFIGAGIGIHTYIFYAWKHGIMTAGDVVFALTTTWNVVMMAWWVGTSVPPLFNFIGLCQQALTIVQVPHDITEDEKAKELVVSRGEIVFDGVTFGYRDKALFQDKTLAIHHGERVGLVGYSGAGKTTFVQLILRFYNIDQGRILIDGQDISSVTLESLRKQIAVIPQDPQLFHRSLRENIRYGRLDATDKEVVQAAQMAHCHSFITSLPDGYNTVIGQKGIKLSGGQRQRIAIARAFISNAPILILDEATSALDSKTESEIQEALKKLMQGRTTIVIAHRLSTLRGLDRILVFHKGKVVEQGSHAALIATDGLYASMWKLQAGGMLNDGSDQDSDYQEII